MSPAYVPRFAMPIGPPPPPGISPQSHYAAMAQALPPPGWQLAAMPHLGLRLTFTANNLAQRDLFAVVGGTVAFAPTGATLPIAGFEPSAGTGSVVLRTWPVDFATLRFRGKPNKVIYGNVDPASFRAAMEPHVAILKTRVLQSLWDAFPHSVDDPDLSALRRFYLDKVMLGNATVFVTGGQRIGRTAPTDPNGFVNQLVLRFADSANNNVSPVAFLRSMPWFGPQWVGHPLLAALASFGVRLEFIMQRQERLNWCWAALSASVAAYYRPSTSWVQCNVAGAVLALPDCCGVGATGPCNQVWQLDLALTRVGHLARMTSGPATNSEVTAQIAMGRPVAVRVQMADRTGHFVCIVASLANGYYGVADPDTGSSIVDESTFKTNYRGKFMWTHTYYT